MKTKIITSIIAMALFTPAMGAVDIPKEGNSTCDSSTLKSATGPVSLEADWSANSINITWDGNGGSTPSGGATTCTYDGTFNLPTAPTRNGYTFAGWAVKNQSCFANLPSTVLTSPDLDCGYGLHYDNDLGTWSGELAEGHWDREEEMCVVDTTYGIVSGISKCSSTSGTFAQAGTPSDENGANCWCQVQTYTPNGGTQCTVSSPVWVFDQEYVVYDPADDAADLCASDCANACVTHVRGNLDFRLAAFGIN